MIRKINNRLSGYNQSPERGMGYLKILLFLSALLAVIMVSCDKYHDPAFNTLDNYRFSFINDQGMKLVSGQAYPGMVEYQATMFSLLDDNSLKVNFEVVSGGGTISKLSTFTDNNGIASTGWTLGTKSFEQVLRASAYNTEGTFLNSSEITAYGFRNNQWDTVSALAPDCYIWDFATDTINKITLMLSGSTLYKQGSLYYDWEMISNSALDGYCSILDIDSNGVFYLCTYDGKMFKSNDHSTTWVQCTEPYNSQSYFYFCVSNDNWLWSYKQDSTIKYSSDGGSTWHKAGNEIYAKGLNDVYRLKNGSILFQGDQWSTLYRSDDNGSTWTHITTPDYTIRLWVSKNDDIMVWNSGSPHKIYRSTDMGATFQLIISPITGLATSYRNHEFTKYGNFYYVVIPGYGIMKTSDLLHYQDYWLNHDLLDLFIDQNGVLIGKSWRSNTIYYRKNSG